jgi:4-hydroxybenzoate polyprenyltransferase
LASFAILQNLAREICKDIKDVNGDQLIGVVSIPISYGVDRTKSIISFILILEIACFIFIFKQLYFELNFVRLIALSVAIGINLIVLFFLSKNRDMIKSCDMLLKLSMAIGLSTLYF